MSNEKSIAGKQYDPSAYQSSSEVESGLAITHEQVSDSFMKEMNEDQSDNKNSIPFKKK